MSTPELIEQKLEKIAHLVNEQTNRYVKREKIDEIYFLQIQFQLVSLATRLGISIDEWKALSSEAEVCAQKRFLERSNNSTNF